MCRLASKTYLDGWMDVIGWAVLLTSIKIGRIYGSIQRRHRSSSPPNQPIRNKYDKYLWRRKYSIMALQQRRLAEKKMSLLQYFRLLLDYRDIWIYPNERTMACALMPTNYFVVVLPSRQIKRVVRLTACNYKRCVFVTIFSGLKIRL